MEAMISAAILAIGLVGLAKLHISSTRGTVKAEEIGRAAEVARQIADTFTTMDYANIPPCAPGPTGNPGWYPNGAGGCASATGGDGKKSNVWNPPKALAAGRNCTTYYKGDGVPDVNDVVWSADPMNGDGSAALSGGVTTAAGFGNHYRIDLAVSRHPDGANFQAPAGAAPVAGEEEVVSVLWVWVCWQDDNGSINEVSATRVIPFNI
jgi:hypothetical protein